MLLLNIYILYWFSHNEISMQFKGNSYVLPLVTEQDFTILNYKLLSLIAPISALTLFKVLPNFPTGSDSMMVQTYD